MSLGRWIGLAGIAVAVAVWVWWLLATVGPAAVGTEVTVLLALGVVVDVVAAVAVLRGRVNRGVLAWLAVRILLSIASLLFLTLIPYAVAAIALSRPGLPDAPVGNPDAPHAFRPPAAPFMRPLTNIGYSSEQDGMVRHTHGACAVCGHLEDDPIHAPAD